MFPRQDCTRLLASGLEQLRLELPAGISERLLDYLQLLVKWNNIYNLTAVRDPREMVTRHLLDSLAVLPYLCGETVADVGTGAGLPGIPLALASPTQRYVLLDSNGKKTRFVTQALHELKPGNATCIRSRVEDYRPGVGFNNVVTRAFSDLGQFSRLAGHLCLPGGRLLAMKGTRPDAEMQALPADFKVVDIQDILVPGLDAERCLVMMGRIQEQQ